MRQVTYPTLHHLTSSRSLAVLMALEEASALRPDGLEYKLRVYPRIAGVAPPAIQKHSPRGKSPIMIIETRDSNSITCNTETLTEAVLLLQYISNNYTAGEWIPKSQHDRQRASFFVEFLQKSFWEKVYAILLFDILPQSVPWGMQTLIRILVTPIVNAHLRELEKLYGYLESSLSDEQPWFSGGRFGLADFTGIFAMDVAVQREFAWDARKYPRLQQWYQAYTGRASYQRALERGGAYDLKLFT